MNGRAGRTGSAAFLTGCAALGLVGSLVGLSILGAVDRAQDVAPVGLVTALRTDRVPPEYLNWIERAGRLCEEVSAPLLAAQIEAESGWDPKAVSPAHAEGLSQFIPGTWATWGVDAAGRDGGEPDGVADPFTPGDAIMTQARYDCWLADKVEKMNAGGDPTRLILAAYNAGPGAVERFGGVPPSPETQGYVARIIASMSTYTGGEPAEAGGSFGDRVVANARKWLGTPYSWGGGGPEGPGLGFAQGADTVGFDCSSLVQNAVYHASGGSILLPRVSQLQVTSGKAVARDDLRPGDVIGFQLNGSYDHIGIYIGQGQFIHAPKTGDVVKINDLDEPYYAGKQQKVRRFG
ncbi:NlpC/P60 family protein [Streptomyces ortus]|uniref:Bifunctional lytic transglycosylase/C40 family peptidase n=1 Tax=Streptomyces ortus TaxID=2867268 RepID=A0ABT3UZM1_9ACTN|nr:bifunctional lytic transglycosylase/C40 family peptidase [Streptomyces ortus]MCX4233219.1 bifunctional lytic transglycosylase/C40 family peptidase [Streptomyces ortus]